MIFVLFFILFICHCFLIYDFVGRYTFDLVTVAKDFGKKETGLTADLDQDGDVDIFNLVIVARNFGKKL